MADAADNKGKPQGKGRPPATSKKPGGSTKKIDAAVLAEASSAAKAPARLRVAFDTNVRPKLASEKGVKNPMQHPKLEKIVININVGRHLEGTKIPPHVRDQVIDTITRISGQKPIMIRSRKAVSNFKLREGYESSYMVTMRRERMWHFLDRMINLVTPRIKDFRGLPDKAFDRSGNYSFGLTEQGVFPEINMAEATFTHGMHINLVFRNSNADLSKFVLAELGMPFRKPDQK
jgi:large subunit ribosomal protein L5